MIRTLALQLPLSLPLSQPHSHLFRPSLVAPGGPASPRAPSATTAKLASSLSPASLSPSSWMPLLQLRSRAVASISSNTAVGERLGWMVLVLLAVLLVLQFIIAVAFPVHVIRTHDQLLMNFTREFFPAAYRLVSITATPLDFSSSWVTNYSFGAALSIIIALTLLGAFLLLRHFSPPRAETSMLFSLALTAYNAITYYLFVLDIHRIRSLQHNEDFLSFMAWMLFLVPCFTCVMMSTFINVKERAQNPAYNQWSLLHSPFMWLCIVISGFSLDHLLLSGTEILGLRMFSAPWSDEARRNINILSSVTNVLRDIPQLLMQIYWITCTHQIDEIWAFAILSSVVSLILSMWSLGSALFIERINWSRHITVFGDAAAGKRMLLLPKSNEFYRISPGRSSFSNPRDSFLSSTAHTADAAKLASSNHSHMEKESSNGIINIDISATAHNSNKSTIKNDSDNTKNSAVINVARHYRTNRAFSDPRSMTQNWSYHHPGRRKAVIQHHGSNSDRMIEDCNEMQPLFFSKS